jgi:hypothetical protein
MASDSRVVVYELKKSSTATLRFSLVRYGGHRMLDVQRFELLTISSSIATPVGSPLRLRLEKVPEFLAAIQAVLLEAEERGWVARRASSSIGGG